MTRNQEEILWNDICERASSTLFVEVSGGRVETVTSIDTVRRLVNGMDLSIVTPCLRPIATMTEDELNECLYASELKEIKCPTCDTFKQRLAYFMNITTSDSLKIDWLVKNHFDFRGLIAMGLARPSKGLYGEKVAPDTHADEEWKESHTVEELLTMMPSMIGRFKHVVNGVTSYSVKDDDMPSVGYFSLTKEGRYWCAHYSDRERYLCLNPEAEPGDYNVAACYGETPMEALYSLYKWCIDNEFIKR